MVTQQQINDASVKLKVVLNKMEKLNEIVKDRQLKLCGAPIYTFENYINEIEGIRLWLDSLNRSET